MFGIIFYWHTDLRRILTDYGFSGFPLRKDFPMSGFIEVLYSQKQKRLLYNRVVLAQEYRNFSFEHFTSFWVSQKFTSRNKVLILHDNNHNYLSSLSNRLIGSHYIVSYYEV